MMNFDIVSLVFHTYLEKKALKKINSQKLSREYFLSSATFMKVSGLTAHVKFTQPKEFPVDFLMRILSDSSNSDFPNDVEQGRQRSLMSSDTDGRGHLASKHS